MNKILEIERKWLLPYNISVPESLNIEKIKITQMYLISDKKERIRISDLGSKRIFTHTVKEPAEGGGNWEWEREIDEKEFCELALRVNKEYYIILKERNVFYLNGTKYELDRFSHPVKFNILEVEVSSFDAEVHIPDWLSEAIEVTNIKGFSNKRIASKTEEAIKKSKELLGF